MDALNPMHENFDTPVLEQDDQSKKVGKVIASIFTLVYVVVSLITIAVGYSGKKAQEVLDALRKVLHENSSEMTESDMDLAESVEDLLLNLDHLKIRLQGIVAAILSIVVLVTVLVRVPQMPIIFLAIACVSALAGGIFCGIWILIYMVVARIGCIMVLVAGLQEQESVSTTVS